MKKKTKILIGVLIFLILIQFIRPGQNNGNIFGRNDISHEVTIPGSTMKILKRSCFDCHSNQTNYPWYAQVNPVGWWLNYHVNEGKKELNFSEFVTYEMAKKLKKLEEIADEVKEHKMPLESYTLLHKEGTLNNIEISEIINWTMSATKEMKVRLE